MVLTKRAHKEKMIMKAIPSVDMTTSIGDHHRNQSALIPIEQKLLAEILEEVHQIRSLLEKKR